MSHTEYNTRKHFDACGMKLTMFYSSNRRNMSWNDDFDRMNSWMYHDANNLHTARQLKVNPIKIRHYKTNTTMNNQKVNRGCKNISIRVMESDGDSSTQSVYPSLHPDWYLTLCATDNTTWKETFTTGHTYLSWDIKSVSNQRICVTRGG